MAKRLIGTATTDANGVATITYESTSAGDINIIAECEDSSDTNNLVSETYSIEDCIYARNEQYDFTKSDSVYSLVNSDTISNLPSTYKIEFDMKSTNNPTNNNEQRIYFAPKSLWNGNSQPSLATFVGYCLTSGVVKLEAGKRLNGQTSESTSRTVVANEWSSIRIENIGSDRFCFYQNDESSHYTWWTVNGMGNYSEFVFGFALWSNTTISIKNIKIKPL